MQIFSNLRGTLITESDYRLFLYQHVQTDDESLKTTLYSTVFLPSPKHISKKQRNLILIDFKHTLLQHFRGRIFKVTYL